VLTDTVLFDSLQFGEILGKGGEATVFRLRHDAGTVAKLYHQHSHERAEKLLIMVENPPPQLGSQPDAIIAWPQKRIRSKADNIVGFLMPTVPAGEPVANLYNTKTRLARNPHFHWQYLLRTAANLARSFSKIHAAGYVVGDVNDMGVLVTNRAIVSLVDCDSFQVKDPRGSRVFRCNVGIGMFTPPELSGTNFARTDRTVNHDAFGIATIIYLLLLGVHPFSIKVKSGEQPTPEDAIKHGLYPDANSSITAPPHAAPVEILPMEVRRLFRAAFVNGTRPEAKEWVRILDQTDQTLKRCRRNENHVFSEHLTECPWCDRALSLGRDPFPSNASISRKEHLKAPVKTGAKGGVTTITTQIPIPHVIAAPQHGAAVASASQAQTAPQAAPKADDGLALVVCATFAASLWAFAVDSREWGIIWLMVGALWSIALLYARNEKAAAVRFNAKNAASQTSRSTPSVNAAQTSARVTQPPNLRPLSASTGPRVVASAQRSKYHVESCEWARRIRGKNRIIFQTPGEAVRYGLVPCGACNPPIS
jgi:hypothetical protein